MTTKQNLLSNAEKKDESIVKSYEDFKKLSKAYLDFVDKCSKQSTNYSDIDSLKDLSLESTEQFVYRIIHWKDFVDSLPSKFKSIFSSNGKYTQKDILSMVGDIPTNYEYPTQTLEQDMKKVNKLIIKRTQIKELETGKTYGNEIREEQTTKIIENIIKNSDDKTQHKKYFDEMIEKDKLQFEYLESCIQQETDLTTKQKIQQNYKFLLQYREKAYNIIRENLDKYEKQLSEFLLKLQKMKTENAGPLKEVKAIIEQFVNYKNNPNRMNIIYQNMVKDIDMSKIITLVSQSPYDEYITITGNNTLNINLGKIDERNFNILLQKIKQEVLEYINQNDGILIQFTKALDEAGLMKVDFTDMILNVYLNLIIIVCIKPIIVRDKSLENDLISINRDYDSLNGLDGNLVYQDADDNIKAIFDKYFPENERNGKTINNLQMKIINERNILNNSTTVQDYTLKQPTVLINLNTITNGLSDDQSENGKINQLLYNLVNNFIQSTYGSLLLIIQKFTSEYNNIYNLLGKGREDEVIDDAFGAYVLFNRLHDLFIYQAGRIVSERNNYGQLPEGIAQDQIANVDYQLTRDDVLKVYQTIQVKNSSKYFEIYNFLMNIKLNSVPMDYKDYVKHINKLWNLEQGQVNKSVLNPKVINLLRNYIQELINCMIIDLNANNSTNMTANPIQYFGADFQNVFNGINTFDQIDKRENRLAETDKIIEETRPMSQKESLLNLYMHLSTYIDKFTKNYIESYGAQDKEQDEKQFKSAIEKQLEYARDIYLTKTETQSNITGQTIGKDKYKLEFLISTLANNQEILDIKSDFEYYYLDFGIQYRQLKEIHWEIIKILYKYHKNYVEFDISRNMGEANANENYQGFKDDFEQAIIYLNQNRQNELYTWYLRYYGIAIPAQKITQDKLSYVASYFVNNTQIIETKIYLRLISDLETYLNDNQINNLDGGFNIPEQHNPVINEANAKLILNYLIHKEIITKYNPENVENYKAIPFQIKAAVAQTPAELYIITNNYYNYFQQNLPYMRKFIARTLVNYQNALKLFIHIPYLKVSGGEIITDDLFRFLDEARKSIIDLYNKQVSPYTREEVKQNIRNQLNLSLDIVPVLRDIFAKYVVPPEDYYKQFQYFLANRENSFFTESYDRKSKLYILKNILPSPLGKVSVKAFTSETVDGEEEQKVNQTYNSIVSCEMENKNLPNDPRIDILNDVNKEIHKIHSIITQYSQGIPELFKSIVMQNNQIKQSTQIFDITYKNNIYQLPINAIQTPFYVKLDQLDVDAKQKFDLINNLITKHEFGLNGKQFLTPALMQFMVLTQKPRKNVYGVDIPITFNDIPVQTKMAYMNLYNMIKNRQQLTKRNFTDIPNFDENLTIMTNQNANIEGDHRLDTLVMNGINNIIPNGVFDTLVQLLISQKYGYINNTFVQLHNDGLMSAYTKQIDNFYIVENNNFENMKLMKDYSGQQYKYVKCDDAMTYNNITHKTPAPEKPNNTINMNMYYRGMLNLLNDNVPNGNWEEYFRNFNVNLKYHNNANANQTRTFTIDCMINHEPLNINDHPEIIARILYIINQKIKLNQFPDTGVADVQNIANEILQNVFRNIFDQYNLDQIQLAIVDVQGQNNRKALSITITDDTVNNIFNQFNSPRLTAFREINPDPYLNISQNNFTQIITTFKLNNGIIVQIPLTNMDKKAADNNIITKAYQDVLKDQISQIIKQNNNLDDQVLVLYDKESQRINLFEENQQIKSQDTSVISMFNALALIDKIEQKPLSMEEKCIIVHKLEEKLPTLSLMVDQYRQIFPEVIDVLIIYRNACQNLIQEYSKGINVRTLFNTNYYTQFFAPEMFDPNSDELSKLFGNDQDATFRQRNYFVFSSDLKKALIWFILKHKPEEFLKTIANRSIPIQSIKNYYMYRKLSEVSANNQLIQPDGDVAHQIPNILEENKQFMRLAFVKRLTKKYRIIGEDHHYVVNPNIGILAQQTTFATNPAIGGASQPQFSPDWYDRYNTKKEIYENVLLNNINTDNSLKLSENNLLLVDIRRVPYLQKYMKQMYMFAVNNKHKYYNVDKLFNGANDNGVIRLINISAHNQNGQFVPFVGIENQAQLDQAIANLKQQIIDLCNNTKYRYVNETVYDKDNLWNSILNIINTTFKRNVNNVVNNVVILRDDIDIQLARQNLFDDLGENEFQYVIPDHLMYEISYLAGFTNKGTLSFENQLTFDLTYQNNTQNEITRYRQYNVNKELTPSVKLIMSLVYSFLAMNDGTKTQNFYQLISEPILYTYNCANNRFKYISQIKDELKSNEQNEKLFIILNLQPFHPIQLLKDNQMYPLFKIFNVYLDKYKTTWLNQAANYYMNTEGMFVKLNTKTNYGQEILMPYSYNNTQNSDPMDNQRLQIISITENRIVYYLNYNSKDYLIQVEYNGDKRITKQSELISLLQNNNLPNLNITNSNVIVLDEINLSRSEIVENNNADMDDMSTVILHIPVNSDLRNDLYVLAKYQNINLLGNRDYDQIKNLLLNQRLVDDNNRAWGQPGAFKFNRLISQIFEWILSQRNVINENQNEKNKIRYSQYHILYE